MMNRNSGFIASTWLLQIPYRRAFDVIRCQIRQIAREIESEPCIRISGAMIRLANAIEKQTNEEK